MLLSCVFYLLAVVVIVVMLLLGLSLSSVKSSYLKQVLVLVMLFLGSCIYISLAIYLQRAEFSV